MTTINFDALQPQPEATSSVERLRLMARMLNEVADGEWTPTEQIRSFIGEAAAPTVFFDLQTWGCEISDMACDLESSLEYAANVDEEAYFTTTLERLQKSNCGYSACAVGHAALDHRFNKLGLQMDPGQSPILVDDKGTTFGWDAVRRFFGVNQQTAEWLFMPECYPLEQRGDPLAVAARCEMLAEGRITIEEIEQQYIGASLD